MTSIPLCWFQTCLLLAAVSVSRVVAVQPRLDTSNNEAHDALALASAPNASKALGLIARQGSQPNGQPCWGTCGKAGVCDWCGLGKGCCRRGWTDDPHECRQITHFLTESHECVDLMAGQSLQDGDDCWFPCGKAGECDKCNAAGLGQACCRKGWGEDPEECRRAVSFRTEHHECVELHPETWSQSRMYKILKPFGLFIVFTFLFCSMIVTQSLCESKQMDDLGIEDEVLGGEFHTDWYHRYKADLPQAETESKKQCAPAPRGRKPFIWEFSHRFSMEDILDDDKRAEYLKEYISWESKFIDGPGVNASGLTNDGVNPDGGERDWSAASKEALHLCCLARRLSMPSPLCEHLMTMSAALVALNRKVAAYEKFISKHPRFHGYLPWFLSEHCDPTGDWKHKFPCLDNGQFAWALYETIHACSDAGHEDLASRFRKIFNEICDFAVLCGYSGAGQIATQCSVPERGNPRPGGHDPMPWDQEPFSYFVDLFGNWEKAGYSPDERDKLWNDGARVRGITKATLKTAAGDIDVLKGWHFSSHEMWKYLQLPLRNIECSRNVLLQCERARTHWAADHKVPGLWASCSSPSGRYVETGIAEGVTLLKRSNYDVLTPYGAFPTILADQATGVAFLKTMLDGRNMQGKLGSMESIWKDGSGVCEVLTWDAKITTVLAVLGGGDHLERYLRKDGLWERFEWITTKMYGEKFGSGLAGSDLPFKMPTAVLPK